MQIPDSLYNIIEKYLAGTASAEEEKIVNNWYHSFTDNEVEINEEDNKWESDIGNNIKSKLLNTIQKEKVKPMKRWLIPSAAAVVLIMLSVGSYFLFNKKNQQQSSSAFTSDHKIKNDIKPGGNKAILTLADGTAITLDSAANGMLAQQGNAKVIKLSGGNVAYTATEGQHRLGEVLYNSISTPRGGQYQITLPDGTKVWLDASSSLRFPTAFTGNERDVEITGEAYFEVAKNAAMPFKVKVNDALITVLGTHFNIMAYDNESSMNTTLLEGSLRVTKNDAAQLLQPGQQAQLNKNGIINLVKNADTEEAVAWKNGMFQFNSTDIKTIMRQIERWYNVEIIFNENVNLHFSGQITRDVNVSQVLRKLELTNEVHFKIENKTIIVNP